jgi:hypothetical protein
MERFVRRHPDTTLKRQLAQWYQAHPDGTPQDAMRDLDLPLNPDDGDARWLVWRCLPEEAKQQIGPVR